uniref:Cyclic nucleotide-binding domain-containing protein n=1 Tax=Percolomonas cosmopolitus TaxID=63605 RepID=A0A7S1PHX9_9EUKA|mmetsp:Transcript_5574/g.20972  ORF Transcript_5574/g.20972 Transcript_5574/m.20972 type:complete len:217 (+) Transcript_5574:1258-1908(+)|eukprot:CAMPEP_0117435272 /NCGR_PEP_ID=MMETSP0759-20121206/393_1 /TAXON_ID=63605 /ORGANISM="Percolomonas cosmopolitus, Strain WS" /LENGTH=216 /DNA_ID=CAMNT_0005226809 /DNA_START=1194 /DNA_END=1844 /DNA_ORIENTATION=+
MPIMQYYATKPSESEVARKAYYKRRRPCLRGLRRVDLRKSEETSYSEGEGDVTSCSLSLLHTQPPRHITDRAHVEQICDRMKDNQLSLLRTFPVHILHKLISLCVVKEFRKEDIIVTQGDTARKNCYILLRGHIRVTKRQRLPVFQDTQRKTHLAPFDTFGELALYDPWAPSEATCIAEDDVECLVLSPIAFESTIRKERDRKRAQDIPLQLQNAI